MKFKKSKSSSVSDDSAPFNIKKKRNILVRSVPDILCLFSSRLQVAAPHTWSASRTSMPSTPSWTTWSWSARFTAHWPARGRTHSSPKVLRLLHYHDVVSFTAKMLQECVINVSVIIKGHFLLPLSRCRGVCSCCQQVWSNHSHGNWHPVPAVWPALPLWVNTHTATLINHVIVSVAQIL